MARTPQKPDPNEASASYSGTGQGKDARHEERRKKGVYGAHAEQGPGYEHEDEEKGGRYGLEPTVERPDDEGSSEAVVPPPTGKAVRCRPASDAGFRQESSWASRFPKPRRRFSCNGPRPG
jgi:hypothetical protein